MKEKAESLVSKRRNQGRAGMQVVRFLAQSLRDTLIKINELITGRECGFALA